MQELKKIYNKISKQTQNRLQEIFDTFDLSFDTLYNIADTKTKNRINTYINEWKDKGLLTGYFGTLANNIYDRTRVKNSEILELLIYGAYIEEQSKLQESELNIFKDVASYYYQQGQQEVNNTLPKNKKKQVSVIPDAIFLALMDVPNATGLSWKQYIDTIVQYNANQIYKQTLINIQQQKQLEIDSSEYQNIINNQIKQKININDNKISGATDLELIGLNNLAKTEGIKSIDENARVRFIAVIDGKETDMCHSLDGQLFYIDKENEFDRYYGETQKELSIQRIKCFGLVVGLNLPPISHHFHWCRSTITYQVPVEKQEKIEYNENDFKNRIIKSTAKNLFNYNTKGISKIALIQNLINGNKVLKDFTILEDKIKSIKVKNNNDYVMSIGFTKDVKALELRISKNNFKNLTDLKENYSELVKRGEAPKGTTYKDIYLHELGHGVTAEIIKKKYNNKDSVLFDAKNNITANEIVDKAFKNIEIVDIKSKDLIKKKLSTYALENSAETIGEAFCDYYSNGDKAKNISKSIINIMKGMI